jgi:AbrB family transcriptional regulator (stage V sporulation protein T)
MEGFFYMKATGIVRRIDDLGRIVIPKEIRRTLRIRESDPLEIFTDREGEIILKKYSPLGELTSVAGPCAESLARTMGCLVCICDKDQIIAVAGNGRKELQGRTISGKLEESLSARRQIAVSAGDKDYISVLEGQDDIYEQEIISPVICEGDVIGGIVALFDEGKQKFTEVERKLIACVASFLGKQMEQ